MTFLGPESHKICHKKVEDAKSRANKMEKFIKGLADKACIETGEITCNPEYCANCSARNFLREMEADYLK